MLVTPDFSIWCLCFVYRGRRGLKGEAPHCTPLWWNGGWPLAQSWLTRQRLQNVQPSKTTNAKRSVSGICQKHGAHQPPKLPSPTWRTDGWNWKAPAGPVFAQPQMGWLSHQLLALLKPLSPLGRNWCLSLDDLFDLLIEVAILTEEGARD